MRLKRTAHGSMVVELEVSATSVVSVFIRARISRRLEMAAQLRSAAVDEPNVFAA